VSAQSFVKRRDFSRAENPDDNIGPGAPVKIAPTGPGATTPYLNAFINAEKSHPAQCVIYPSFPKKVQSK
jgi:hypothetical protein